MADYLYQPGQEVVIRPDLSNNKGYRMLSGPRASNKSDWWGIFPFMKRHAGKVITIDCITEDGVYTAKGISGCVWTDEMFAGPANDECYCQSLL